MKEQRQITMYDFIEQAIKKSSTYVSKAVNGKNVITPRVIGYIVRG